MKTSHHVVVRAFLVGLALCLFSGAAFAGHADKIWEGKGKGRSADAQFSAAGGGGRINVFQNGSSAFLFYEVWGDDPTSRYCVIIDDEFGNPVESCVFTRFLYDYGWGEIPSADIQFTAAGADLSTTTGASFSATRCTTDKAGATPVTTCAPAPAATFDLTWTLNGVSSFFSKDATEQAFGPFEFSSHGSYEGISAYVDGSALGRTLALAPGRVGDTKGKNVATVVTP